MRLLSVPDNKYLSDFFDAYSSLAHLKYLFFPFSQANSTDMVLFKIMILPDRATQYKI
jgi:hypothetical protein